MRLLSKPKTWKCDEIVYGIKGKLQRELGVSTPKTYTSPLVVRLLHRNETWGTLSILPSLSSLPCLYCSLVDRLLLFAFSMTKPGGEKIAAAPPCYGSEPLVEERTFFPPIGRSTKVRTIYASNFCSFTTNKEYDDGFPGILYQTG